MDQMPSLAETRSLLWRPGRWIIGFFWLVQFLELTLVGFVEGGELAARLILPRAINVVAGVMLTVPIVEIAARAGGTSFRRRLLLTVATALAMCVLLMGVNYSLFFVAAFAGHVKFDLVEFVYVAFGWSWFFLGLAGAVVGLASNVEMRDRERRLAALEIVAKDARLEALRYQLNPHFLFNTLNSIAALVSAGENAAAESMVESLADFLRVTLELDPLVDVPLSQELELQALYLAIEQVRFPSRLTIAYDVAEEAKPLCVPALITQPVVENSIRHAVARSAAQVTITIRARADATMLRIVVEDDGAVGEGDASRGTGVGMANVRARLQNRFGRRHAMTVERLSPGFRTTLEMPRSQCA